MDNKGFHEVLSKNCQFFAETAIHYIKQFSNINLGLQSVKTDVKNIPIISADYVLSISYLGMVFGEYILTLDKQMAHKLFSEYGEDEESIQGCISEVLNMIAGKSITSLGGSYEKLTITAPKVIKGSMSLSHLVMAKSDIQTDMGNLCCYFYIDRMKLDLASSYVDAINDLKSINIKLMGVNEQMKNQQTQLVQQEKMASLGVLAAGMAHEINNPLSFVSGNIEILTTYVEAMTSMINLYENLTHSIVSKLSVVDAEALTNIQKVKAKENIEFIMKDTIKLIHESRTGLERISRIVSGLKKFSKTDVSDRPQVVNLQQDILHVIDMLSHQIHLKDCKVETNFYNVEKVLCYSSGIMQIISNLIINSIQAVAPHKGVIQITTSLLGDNLQIEIKDNGVGIAKENLDKIFNPFFTTRPPGQGVGLGLSISYGLVKRFKGHISVQSEEGSGAHFIVSLPVNESLEYQQVG